MEKELWVNIVPMGEEGWELLREQKCWLTGMPDYCPEAEGLLNVIDRIQASAVEDAGIPRDVVFGKPSDWDLLDSDVQEALLEWYNICEENVTDDDRQMLAGLYKQNRFEFGNCSECGDLWTKGDPEDWSLFQGVNEVEHVGDVCGECYMSAARVIQASGAGWVM